MSTKLPAMNITENPLEAQSGVLKAQPCKSTRFESEFEIAVAESFLDRAGRIDEIIFHYDGVRDAEIWFYDVTRTEWRMLDPVEGFWAYPFRRFLSEMGSPPGDYLMNARGVIRIGANGVDSIWVELLHYHDDYKAVPLPERDHLDCISHCKAEIVSVDGALWIVSTAMRRSGGTRYPCGHLHALDSTGHLVFSSYLASGTPYAVTYGAGAVWAHSGFFGDTYRMSTLDSAGVMTRRFSYWPGPQPGTTPSFLNERHLTWGFGRLWVRDLWSNRLFGIPIPETAEEDDARHDWRFYFHELPSHTVITGIVCDGTYFYVQGYDERDSYTTIAKINLSGQNVAVYPVPVRSTGAMAWDGEAMWLVHTGPRHCESQGLMVSRFRLR